MSVLVGGSPKFIGGATQLLLGRLIHYRDSKLFECVMSARTANTTEVASANTNPPNGQGPALGTITTRRRNSGPATAEHPCEQPLFERFSRTIPRTDPPLLRRALRTGRSARTIQYVELRVFVPLLSGPITSRSRGGDRRSIQVRVSRDRAAHRLVALRELAAAVHLLCGGDGGYRRQWGAVRCRLVDHVQHGGR